MNLSKLCSIKHRYVYSNKIIKLWRSHSIIARMATWVIVHVIPVPRTIFSLGKPFSSSWYSQQKTWLLNAGHTVPTWRTDSFIIVVRRRSATWMPRSDFTRQKDWGLHHSRHRRDCCHWLHPAFSPYQHPKQRDCSRLPNKIILQLPRSTGSARHLYLVPVSTYL
jgi:hypothetical protein